MGVMHLSLSVRGALNQSDRELKPWCGNITVDGKKLMSVREIRAFLMDALADGYELLPMSDCPTFDKMHGCQCWRKEKNDADKELHDQG